MFETDLLLPTLYQRKTFSLKKKRGYKNSSSDDQNAQEVDPKALEYIRILKKNYLKEYSNWDDYAREQTVSVLMIVKDCESLYIAHTHNKDYNNHS